MSIKNKYGNFPLLGQLVAILSLPRLYTLHHIWDKYRLYHALEHGYSEFGDLIGP